MNKPILAWINCYGAWAPDLRHPVETIGYDLYLNTVVAALAALHQRIAVVYVSGGMPDSLRRTECATTIPELEKRLAQKGIVGLTMKADEESVTSISIVRQFLTVWSKEYPSHLPLLFCDAVREETNTYLLQYFGQKLGLTLPAPREILLPIARLDIHENSTPEKQAEKLQRLQKEGVEVVEQQEIAARKKN